MLVGVLIAVTCKVPRNSGEAYFGEMKQQLGVGALWLQYPCVDVSSGWQCGWDNSVFSDGKGSGMAALDSCPWRGAGPWKTRAKALLLFLQEQPIKEGCEMALHVSQLPLPDWKRAKDCFISTC